MIRFVLTSVSVFLMGATTTPWLQSASVARATAPESVAIASGSQRIDRAADGLFYLTADVNGVPVRFIVDTGSNLVVLTRADANRARVLLGADAGQPIQTAGGTSRMTRAQLGTIELAGQNLRYIDAAVVGSGLPTSLLGQSALSRLATVTIRGDTLHLDRDRSR